MADEPDAGPSWHEREVVACLKRVANARSNLAALGPDPATVDPDDVARVQALEAEAEPLRKKAGSRFGGGAARDQLAELEAQQRLILERLGVADVAEAEARLAEAEGVDATMLEFARRELEQAEAELAEVLAMDIPEPDGGGDDDGAAIDLRDESAAS